MPLVNAKLGFKKLERKWALFEMPKTFIARRELREHPWWVPLKGLSNLFLICERKLRFQKDQRKSAFFESRKPLLCGWGGVGWTLTKKVLSFSSCANIFNTFPIFTSIYSKVVRTNLLWVLNFCQVEGPEAKIHKLWSGFCFNHHISRLTNFTPTWLAFLRKNLEFCLYCVY